MGFGKNPKNKMSTGRAINYRFPESQSGYTRATGPEFSFQADPILRQQATSAAVARDMDPNVMRLDTEYNDQYCGPSGIIPDATIKQCFTNPYTGLPCGNQMLSTGQIYNTQNFPQVGNSVSRPDTMGETAGPADSTGLQGAPRVLIPGSQPGSNEGTRAIYNQDVPKTYEFNPDQSFGRRTGAALPVTGSGRLDGLQRTGNLGASMSQTEALARTMSATQPEMAASFRASQGIIPGSVGDLEQMKDQGVVGTGNRQYPEWHAPECDQQTYCMGQSMKHGVCPQKCTNREIIPGSQPGSNEGTRAVCGTGTGRTIPFNRTGISTIGGAKRLYQTGQMSNGTMPLNQTLDGTMLPATVSKSMNSSQFNSAAAVPELPAIKSPAGLSKTPAKAASAHGGREDRGDTQAEIQAALQFGQQLENQRPQHAQDIAQTVSNVANNVVNSAQLHQSLPQQSNWEPDQDYAQRIAQETMARSHPSPAALSGTASSNAVDHDNLYASVKNPSPEYDSGLPVNNVNANAFNRTTTPSSVTTTTRPNSIPGATRFVGPSNEAVASSGSINERGFNEPPMAETNVYAKTVNSQQLYQPSNQAYNPSHSYSAFANNPSFPSSSRCCTRSINGCIPPGGCQCGTASSKTRWDATRTMGITEEGVEYVKPPHTTFCDAPVARSFLGAQRHQYPHTASTGAYTSTAEMAAAGFCDKDLCQTTRMYSSGNGAPTYKTLNAYIPAYSAYRRPWPGNYNEKFSSTAASLRNTQTGEPHKVTDETAASKESGFVENCKFDTKPFNFVPGERPIGFTETFVPEEGNKVGGGGNAPENPNEFLTTHNDHYRAIYEPQYGKLYQHKNDGQVPREGVNTDGTFNGLLSSSRIKANVTFKPGREPLSGTATGPRRCTCYDKINNVWM